jgi:tripartite ATP-independent transporter DctP family solute receptor
MKFLPLAILLAATSVHPVVAQTTTFTLATTNGAKDLSTQAMERWKTALAEKSGGRLAMELSIGGALGGDQELLQQLASNEIQMNIAGPIVLHRLVTEYQCLEAEYVIENEAHGFRVWRGDLGREVSDALKERFNIEIVGVGARGARQLTSNKPVRVPADMAGMKVRVTNPLRAEIFTAYGALPGTLPVSELYGGLLQGVFDAQENPIPTIYGERFYEVQKYIDLTGHVWSFNVITASVPFLEGLSAEDRKVYDETLAEAIAWLDAAVANDTAALVEQMKTERGVEVVEVDVPAFAAIAAPIVEAYAKENCRAGLLDDVRAEAE